MKIYKSNTAYTFYNIKHKYNLTYTYDYYIVIRICVCLFIYLILHIYVYIHYISPFSLLFTGNGRVIGAPLRMRRPEDQSPSAASAGLMMEVVRHSI